MALYIKGMGNISPQQTWSEKLPLQPIDYTTNKLTCVEPDYANFTDVRQLRRMSRIIKMGVASSAMALKEAEVSIPDSIITATGYGCLEDTGIFLKKMIENSEKALNPTPFIQSTHNTIGSQIALLLQCQEYNQTYTHGAFSFESALMDAMMQADNFPDKKILLGGIDEITDYSHQIQSRFGIYRQEVKSSLNLFNESNAGTINGEGSAFFVLSGLKDANDIACILGVATCYKPGSSELLETVLQFLSQYKIKTDEIDLVISGKSGDIKYDHNLEQLTEKLFPNCAVALFKNLCGEYPVASGFACALSARILKEQTIPEYVLQKPKMGSIRNVLILNQYFGTHYSFVLLKAC